MAGISVQGSILSASPGPSQTIKIRYLVRPARLIEAIQVVYGDSPSQAPPDCVLEYNNGNDDIKFGLGGLFVWLRSSYIYQIAEAATILNLSIQEEAHAGWDDLAKGAGGSSRHLEPAAGQANPYTLTDLRLYHPNTGVDEFPRPFSGHTSDMNANCRKTYLYLIWSTQPAF